MVAVSFAVALVTFRNLPAYREARSALRVPFFSAMSRAVGETPSSAGNRWQLLLNLVVWALLVAAARPVFIEKPIEQQQPVRDLLLAIDISQSMETEDFTDANGQKTMSPQHQIRRQQFDKGCFPQLAITHINSPPRL